MPLSPSIFEGVSNKAELHPVPPTVPTVVGLAKILI